MFYVYFLRSSKNGSYYVGQTDDLKSRYKQHNAGRVKSTRPLRPYTLVYYEAYTQESQAIFREQELKHKRKAKEEVINRITMAPSSSG